MVRDELPLQFGVGTFGADILERIVELHGNFRVVRRSQLLDGLGDVRVLFQKKGFA